MEVPQRYARNMPGLGELDCRVLANSRIGVFGCGGVGSWVAETLARMGVGYLRLVDFDLIETSNLNRQLFATEHTIGLPKTQAAAQRIAQVNSSTACDAQCRRFSADESDELLDHLDLIVNEIDVLADRIELIETAHVRGVPVVHTAVNTWRVSACTFVPYEPLPNCLNNFFTTTPEDGVEVEGCIVPTGLPFNCLTAAGICTSEAVRILTGRKPAFANKRFVLDLQSGSSHIYTPACSEQPEPHTQLALHEHTPDARATAPVKSTSSITLHTVLQSSSGATARLAPTFPSRCGCRTSSLSASSRTP